MPNKSNAFFVKEYKNSIPLLDTNYEILFGKFSLAYIAKNCKKKEQADDLLLIVIKLAVDLLCDFLCEVFFSLLKAVALHHTNEAVDFDFRAEFLGN